MAAINLAGAAIQMAFQKHLSDGITAMLNFFKHTDPIPDGHDTLPSQALYSVFKGLDEIQEGEFLFVPPVANGPDPTVANLAGPNQFQLVSMRVKAIGNAYITAERSVPLTNNDSAATADANALATYGALHNKLYFPIPAVVEGIPQVKVLVATQVLWQLMAADPFIPQAPAVLPQPPAPPGPIDNIAQLLQANQNMFASSKETPSKSLMYQRLSNLARILPEGRFSILLKSLMFNLPVGQPVSAGYISLHVPIKMLRDFMYNWSQHLPSRTVELSDTKLHAFIFLNFSEGGSGLADFATPSDKPITFHNIESFVQRICDMLAIFWDIPLPAAVLHGLRQLIHLHNMNDCPDLLPHDLLELLGRKLLTIDRDPAFDTSIAPNGLDFTSNLNTFFSFAYDDQDIRRLQFKNKSIAPSGIDSNPKPAKLPKSPHNTKSGAGSSTTLVPTGTGVSTRADAAKKAILLAWYAELTTSVPALVNVTLPCLYWLSNVAPCLKSGVCLKTYNKKPHVITPIVKANMQAILVWLKKDPLGRF